MTIKCFIEGVSSFNNVLHENLYQMCTHTARLNVFVKHTQKICNMFFFSLTRYDVIVKASDQINSSFTSDTHTIFVQRKVIPNRLVASSSVQINSRVSFNCRINSGTNASYFWNFGDGIERLGSNNDTHVYTR